MTPQRSQVGYSTPEEHSSLFSDNFYIQDPISVLHMTNFLTNMPHYFSSNPSSHSNNSTLDESDRQQTNIICDRKRRRLVSNRESARRSRIRKQKLVEELLSQLVSLRTGNQTLMEQLNHLVESHEKVVDENTRLKEEATDIIHKLDEIMLANTSMDMQCFVEFS